MLVSNIWTDASIPKPSFHFKDPLVVLLLTSEVQDLLIVIQLRERVNARPAYASGIWFEL